jgi:hypothetical protein
MYCDGQTTIFLPLTGYVYFMTGETMGKVWVAFFLAVINAQTMSFYGSFSNLISMHEEVPRAIGLGFGASMGLLNTYRWCNDAQKVEQCVSIVLYHLFVLRILYRACIFRCQEFYGRR